MVSRRQVLHVAVVARHQEARVGGPLPKDGPDEGVEGGEGLHGGGDVLGVPGLVRGEVLEEGEIHPLRDAPEGGCRLEGCPQGQGEAAGDGAGPGDVMGQRLSRPQGVEGAQGAAACGDPNTLGYGWVDCDYPASGSTPSAGDRECDAMRGYNGPTGVGTPNGLSAFKPASDSSVSGRTIG